jgi:signal transduction histidine kinase
LIYPEGNEFSLPDLGEVISRLRSPFEVGIPLASEFAGDMVFAVSLWSAQGLIGVLLLGEKQSGGLYTQEEVEIVRSVGEHLIDIKASKEMARRLIQLQRQRLAQSQIADQGTRRILHDEVLPLVHTSLLKLAGSGYDPGVQVPEVVSQLKEVHHQISDLLSRMPATTGVEVRRSGFVGALRKMIDAETGDAFDEVTWAVEPEGASEFEDIPPLVAEVVFFAAREVVRNAARHGRQGERSGTPFCLAIDLKRRNGLTIQVEDNGGGFDIDRQSWSLEGAIPQTDQDPGGLGDPDISSGQTVPGRYNGHGLALHSAMMAVIGGYLIVESAPGQYTRVTLEVPESAWM